MPLYEPWNGWNDLHRALARLDILVPGICREETIPLPTTIAELHRHWRVNPEAERVHDRGFCAQLGIRWE